MRRTPGPGAVAEAMAVIRSVSPESGSYVNESDFFEDDWQHSYWGDHYPRLAEIKRRYDPGNLFTVHHGVRSD
jgi:FAD/FMN-containing dehydrogenase